MEASPKKAVGNPKALAIGERCPAHGFPVCALCHPLDEVLRTKRVFTRLRLANDRTPRGSR